MIEEFLKFNFSLSLGFIKPQTSSAASVRAEKNWCFKQHKIVVYQFCRALIA
jgi:hypothetical protein